MTKQELSDLMDNNQFATITYNCHDCKQPGNIIAERISETEIKITGRALFKPPENWQSEDSTIPIMVDPAIVNNAE